jgi:sugar phosphate isomerase/epimerase
MFTCLGPGLIGLALDPLATIQVAARHGYQGVDLPIPAIADAGPLREALAATGLRRGCAGGLLPGKTTVPDAEWDAAVAELETRAARAAALGFTRSTSVILPFHEGLPFAENLALHRRRLHQVAPVLAAHGIRLGLEYVSQQTRRALYPHHFVHDLAATLDLLAELDQPTLGLLLDSFHWYCAGEGTADIDALRNHQVVVAHLNDAIAGRSLAEQVAFERELPGASGMLDGAGFLRALERIGYDGPVTAEPMNETLKLLPVDERAATTLAAIQAVMSAGRQLASSA